jgi:hypothetical protein
MGENVGKLYTVKEDAAIEYYVTRDGDRATRRCRWMVTFCNSTQSDKKRSSFSVSLLSHCALFIDFLMR